MKSCFPRIMVLILLLLAVLGVIGTVDMRADTVVLKNGDRLTGTAVKLDGGKLTFKTAYADAIAIAWEQVASLTVNQPLVLPTARENLSVTSVERTATGLSVATASGTATMDPAAVTVLRSPADQKTYEASLHPGWTRAWAGAANLSIALSRGNSQTAAIGTGFTAARTTRTDKTSLYAATLYSHNGQAGLTTADTYDGGGRYDHNINPRLFVFGSGDFSANELQNLSLRSIIGGGFGWHALKAPRRMLDMFGGLVWTHELYKPGPTNSFAALDLGEQFTRKVGTNSLFTEQATFYPDLNQAGQYQFSLDSTLSSRIGKLFNWNTTVSDRYTSFPPHGTKSNDVILTTGLGISFARH